MRIGILGIGDLATKAYLPVLSQMADVELVLCTRNPLTLEQVKKQYRIHESYTDLHAFLESGLEGVFIAAATRAHVTLAKMAIAAGIPVHLDKPIAANYDDCLELEQFSLRAGVPCFIGFNRRFVPAIQPLIREEKPSMVLYRKNRRMDLTDLETMLFDDFIHVIDTARYLLHDESVEGLASALLTQDQKFSGVALTLKSTTSYAQCIMKYTNGIDEEIIDVFFDHMNYTVRDLNQTIRYEANQQIETKQNDWVPTLTKRGFQAMCEAFLDSLRQRPSASIAISDALVSHRIANDALLQLRKKGPFAND